MTTDFRAWLETMLARSTHIKGALQNSCYNAEAAAAEQLSELHSQPELVTALSRYGNGYVREGALRYLQDKPGPAALAIVIERLNDWVPQVRTVARALFLAYLEEQRAEDLFTCMALLLSLHGKTRQDHGALIAATNRLLMQPEHRHALLSALRRQRGGVARHLLLLAWEADSSKETAAIALEHSDPSVRARILDVLGRLDAVSAMVLLHTALRDHFAPIRAAALRLIMNSTSSDEAKRAACLSLLLDRSHGPRSAANWYARQLNMDVPGYYAACLARSDLSDSEHVALLWEASKGQLLAAAPLAERMLANARPLVRTAAFHYMLVAQPARRAEFFRLACQDSSPKLKKYVVDLLRRTITLDGDMVYIATEEAWLRGDIAFAVGLMRQIGLWRGLELMTSLLVQPSAQCSARRTFAEWNSQFCWIGYQRPSSDEQTRLKALLVNVEIRTIVETFVHVAEGIKKAGAWPCGSINIC